MIVEPSGTVEFGDLCFFFYEKHSRTSHILVVSIVKRVFKKWISDSLKRKCFHLPYSSLPTLFCFNVSNFTYIFIPIKQTSSATYNILISIPNTSVIVQEWKHCHFMIHENDPHKGHKGSTAALQMGPVLPAAVGLYEDN